MDMELRGRVHNGVILPEDSGALPEGACVRIVIDLGPRHDEEPRGKRISLPLVRSEHPGSLRLTGEDLARILEEDDLASGH